MSWVEIKHALNSTLGNDEFTPLDKMINFLRLYSSVPVVYDSAGSYNYIVPDGVFRIAVSAAAGGGGGGNYSNSIENGGGGGGGEAVFNKILSVTPGETINITVGSGGSYGNRNGSDGNDGNNTIFGSYFTLSGGKGGKNRGTPGEGGGEGGGSGGGNGEDPKHGITGGGGKSSNGGGGSLGNGGVSSTDSAEILLPIRGGGGGGGYYTGLTATPQAGADGCVIISTYPVSIQQANGIDKSIIVENVNALTLSNSTYTTSELMTAYREGVESIG